MWCAPGRPMTIELQTTAPSPTPTRAEEHIATTPGRGPAGHRAFAHADPRRRTHRHDAGQWSCRPPRLRPRRPAPNTNTSLGCRSCASAPSHVAGLQTPSLRRQSARKMSPKLSLGLPHQHSKGAWSGDEETVRVGLAGCARDQPCASSSSRLPASRLNHRKLGLALVVLRLRPSRVT